MLRVGLTGDLGSGKSTAAAMLGSCGANVFSSDEMARHMMRPGHAVYQQIVEQFGAAIVTRDGSLDRRALARAAFREGRVEELNAIVHPAVLEEQARLLDELSARKPHAIAVVESALIFTTRHESEDRPWRARFDRIVLVRAPLDLKVARFVQRVSAARILSPAEQAEQEQEARRRLALQSSVNEGHAGECLVIENSGDLASFSKQVDAVWAVLQRYEAAAG